MRAPELAELSESPVSGRLRGQAEPSGTSELSARRARWAAEHGEREGGGLLLPFGGNLSGYERLRRHTVGIGGSIFLITVGAILAFAIRVSDSSWIDLNAVGWILMVVGFIG